MGDLKHGLVDIYIFKKSSLTQGVAGLNVLNIFGRLVQRQILLEWHYFKIIHNVSEFNHVSNLDENKFKKWA